MENIIDFIMNAYDNNNYLFILDEDKEVIEIQKELCLKIKNCYIYNNFFKNNNDNNIGYIIYKNKFIIIVKQMIKKFYIKIII